MDLRTIERSQDSLALMERAGEGLLQSLQERVLDCPDSQAGPSSVRQIWILSGKGNNGGDGLVLARLLRKQGLEPRLWLAESAESMTGDARIQYDLAVEAGVGIESEFPPFQDLTDKDVVVDALLGTGLSSAPRGLFAEWIEAITRAPARVVAVDIPSGLGADDPMPPGSVVRADWTVTMAFAKRSFAFPPARDWIGQLDIVDIGIPDEVAVEVGHDALILSPATAHSILPSAVGRDHKGMWGRLLIAGGAPGMSGAPILAAQAALRTGIGLLRVATPKSQTVHVDSHVVEAMTTALPEGEDGQVLGRGADLLLSTLGAWDALAVGPGLGRFPEVDRFVLKLLGGWKGPIVLDADALNVLAAWGADSWVPRVREIRSADVAGGAVLTPHPGEFSRLTGRPVAELRRDPISAAREWAGRWGVTLVAKGAPTVIAAPDGRVWVNPTGHAGLATGGSGDVLTGIIATLLAQGVDGPGAAVLGCYLHGLAADLWESAPRSLTPSDVIERIGKAIARVEEGKPSPRWKWNDLA